MIKKTITYTDFFGEERTDELFFHLSESELLEMEMNEEGGLGAKLQRIVEAKKGEKILAIFKDLLLSSYGERSEDGRRFVKTQEMRDEFKQSAAYEKLFMELGTDSNAAAEFINGMVPAELMTKIQAQEAKGSSRPALQDHLPKKVTTVQGDQVE